MSEKPRFRVGDKVRSKGHDWPDSWWNGPLEVRRVSDGYIYCLGTKIDLEGAFSEDQLELVTPADDEEYLQSLVNKANEGNKAEREMAKLAPNRFIYTYDGGATYPMSKINFTGKKFFLAPPAPKERKFRLQDWDCVITKDTIKIGCQDFRRDLLTKAFTQLVNGLQRNDYVDMVGCKKGIRYSSYVLTWENADRLLAELEAFERETA